MCLCAVVKYMGESNEGDAGQTLVHRGNVSSYKSTMKYLEEVMEALPPVLHSKIHFAGKGKSSSSSHLYDFKLNVFGLSMEAFKKGGEVGKPAIRVTLADAIEARVTNAETGSFEVQKAKVTLDFLAKDGNAQEWVDAINTLVDKIIPMCIAEEKRQVEDKHFDAINADQVRMVAAFYREIVEHFDAKQGGFTPIQAAFLTDRVLVQFMKSKFWVLEKCMGVLIQSLEWREKERPYEIEKDSLPDTSHLFTLYIHGVDSIGRPIVVARLKDARVTDFTEFVKSLIFVMEECLRMMANEAEHWIWLVDLTNFSRKSSPPKNVLQDALHIFFTHYPERMEKLFLVDCPVYFKVFWAIAKPLLDADTKARIHFVKSKGVAQALAPLGCSIPKCFGGDAEVPTGIITEEAASYGKEAKKIQEGYPKREGEKEGGKEHRKERGKKSKKHQKKSKIHIKGHKHAHDEEKDENKEKSEDKEPPASEE